MCAKLLACPLCSQPAFSTLDALRTGLISVATRPLACPVCNEVLLGVDKLTIHLFSHAINLSNNVKRGSDQTRNVENVSCSDNKNINQNQGDGTLAEDVNVESTIAKPLQKITVACESSVNRNSTVSQGSQTCSETQLGSEESTPATNHVIFVQNCSEDNKSFETEEIYLKTISEDGQTCGYRDVKLEEAEKLKQLRIDCVKKSSDQLAKENYTKNILQLQPIWSENILVDCNDSTSRQNSNCQILTITKNAVANRQEKSNESLENNIVEKHETKNSEIHRRSPDRSQVLPQLKAFKALATKEKTERCDICGFYFSDPNILTLHKQLVHMINEQDLNRKSEDLLKNYPCHLCPKIFKMRGSLVVHMRVAHIGYNLGSISKEGNSTPVAGEHGFNCPTCGKNFKKEQHVTQHLKIHEGKQWECDVCSKMFTTKYFLKKHKRLHSGEMPYKCNICDKTFTFQQSYHKHRLYHKDDKPHACTTCGRSFKELSTLHNHERIHTGEKPFACETCGKCFRQRVSYLVHRRIHTGAMPYKCTACGKSFRYKVSQRTHKCTAQPPGTVVRQSSDLVQRLLQVSQIRDSNLREGNDSGLSTIENKRMEGEDNRYVLIVNDQGQHVLTRQSDMENKNIRSKIECERDVDSNKYEGGNEETYIEDLWGHNIPNGTTLKDSIEMSVKSTSIEDCDLRNDGNSDFFSMVLSPSENQVRSPSSEMEHLRLSSPTGNASLIEINKTGDSCVQGSNGFQCALSEDVIEDNFRNDNTRVVCDQGLPTINEESLKQLLYGTESNQL